MERKDCRAGALLSRPGPAPSLLCLPHHLLPDAGPGAGGTPVARSSSRGGLPFSLTSWCSASRPGPPQVPKNTNEEGEGKSEWTLPVNLGLNLQLQKTSSGLLITLSFRSRRRTGPLSQAPVRYQQDLWNPGVSCVGQEGVGEGDAHHSQGEEGARTKQPCIFSQHPLADGQFPPGSASRSLKGTSCWRAPPKLLPFQPGWGTPAGLLFPRRVKTPT